MLFNVFIVFLILLNVICLYVFFIEPHALEVNHHTLPLSETQTAYDGMKIVHLSDLHIDASGWFTKKVLSKINEQNADFIFVTGDLIPYNQGFHNAIPFLNKLKARHGIYIVLGNSDYTNMSNFFRTIKKTPLNPNIIILRNDFVEESYNNAPFSLIGIDDPISGYADPTRIPQEAQNYDLIIQLAHAYTDNVRKSRIKPHLTLTGHMHGGQINIIPRAILMRIHGEKDRALYQFLSGFTKDGETWVNNSRGIGVSYLPIRFLSRPEICVITCKRENT